MDSSSTLVEDGSTSVKSLHSSKTVTLSPGSYIFTKAITFGIVEETEISGVTFLGTTNH